MAKKRSKKPGLTPKRDIRITCEGAALVPLGSLSHFQGQFKTLSKREFEKLRETIETDGFSFPVFAWKNKGKNHIIDGHQRVQALGVMLKDGYSLPGGKLPVAWIEAKTEKEAKRKVLLAASQYGRYDEDSTYRFIEESGLDFAELKKALDLPQLDMGKLEAGWPTDAGSGSATPSTKRLYSDEQVVDSAFKFYRKRMRLYDPIPLHVQMQEINDLSSEDNDSLLTSKRGLAVADAYHTHRMKARVNKMRCPYEVFMDDAHFRVALEKTLELGGTIRLGVPGGVLFAAGAQACGNFRPGFAAWVYRRYGKKGGTVLDPSAGFGGRLVGWVASGLGGSYIGVDPSSLSVNANAAMVGALGLDGVTLIRAAFEDVDKPPRADLIFTSPPYFTKELYGGDAGDDGQSWNRYLDFDAWCEKFLNALIRKSEKAISRNGFIVINIADVKIGSKSYPLEKKTREYADGAGLELIETLRYRFGVRVPGVGKAKEEKPEAVEPVFVFRKSGQ